MKFSDVSARILASKKFTVTNTIIVWVLFLFANLFTVRMMMRDGTQLYLYEQLRVAYQIGGMTGLKSELEEALTQDTMPRSVLEAKVFKENLVTLKDPGSYLDHTVAAKKRTIQMMRHARIIAFGFITALVLLRLSLNFLARSRK